MPTCICTQLLHLWNTKNKHAKQQKKLYARAHTHTHTCHLRRPCVRLPVQQQQQHCQPLQPPLYAQNQLLHLHLLLCLQQRHLLLLAYSVEAPVLVVLLLAYSVEAPVLVVVLLLLVVRYGVLACAPQLQLTWAGPAVCAVRAVLVGRCQIWHPSERLQERGGSTHNGCLCVARVKWDCWV